MHMLASYYFQRETRPKNLQKLKSKEKIESKFTVTLKDYGANLEKTEALEEYVISKSSPWKLDYSWSNEAKMLREVAVKSPWLIDDVFILSFFKTIRIVDKNVSEVDPGFLRFSNLEELTLSCNFITTVNAKNLPRSLKVLELCGNQISDLSSLCVQPPELIHLGLGFNRLSFIGDCLTQDYWPSLLSLDLGHNNLTDLLDVVRKLGSLPKLRNLILQGNPLALIPGYRGYTIDCLRKLSILDDIMISADERHHFKGLARRREYILDEAKVTFEVICIKGVPIPDELKNPEDLPEFPIIERKYFVQFMFPEDTSSKAEVFQLTQDDFGRLSSMASTIRSLDESRMEQFKDSTNTLDKPSEGSQPETVKNVNFTEKPEVVESNETSGEPLQHTTNLGDKQETKKEVEDKPELKLAPIKSAKGAWAEEIELKWSESINRDDLISLRDFFKQGMDFSVVEEVVLCYPAEEPSEDSGSQSEKKDKGKGNNKVEKKDDTKKQGKDVGKTDNKKKKKETEQELKRNPPTYTTLATWHIQLSDFLEGEHDLQSIFTQGGVEVASTIKSMDTDRKDSKNKDAKDKKKPPSAAKKNAKEEKGKDRKPSASGAKGKDDKKDKGKGGKGPAPPQEEEEEPGPPPPLEVEIAFRLYHWKTARDSLKEEEERKQEEQTEKK
ncbi:hypothetical protein ACJMK2_011024 [Sinanodonta woodiana]|uniref:Leucine-rich repeat-containing protein 43 n=1 Tax=Sinanodonta woodiana TaxID=1069815 RepID=A0ABD3V3M5_SINWO